MIDETHFGAEVIPVLDLVPDPVWIYDPQSLRFLDANKASLEKLGYSHTELLTMTIMDIRPPEDAKKLRETVHALRDSGGDAGVWQIRDRHDTVFYGNFNWRSVTYNGVPAVLATVHDVTALVIAERDKARLLSEREVMQRQSEIAAAHFRALFEAAPGKFVVLKPWSYEIVSASDAYLDATMTRRDDITDRAFFDIFPDDPGEPNRDATRNLRASLNQVEMSGEVDVMAVQRYPIPRPESEGGGFVEKFWNPVNSPVTDAEGNVVFIIHRIEDVTEFIADVDGQLALEKGDESKSHLREDILLRSQELKLINSRLQEQEANLRTAQRLLGLGIWKLNLETGALSWCDNVHKIYGVEYDSTADNADRYSDLVHPDDRASMRAHLADYLADPQPQFHYQHRIVREDGSVIHVQGLGELTTTIDGRVLTGVVSDITEDIRNAEQLSRAGSLARIVGRVARIGGWRADLARERQDWSDETAAIHEIEIDTPHTFNDTVNFYAPEYRERIRTLFSACAERGETFDDVLQLITAKGRKRWVRTIGEAQRNEQGEIIAVHGAIQDVTEDVETRAELETMSQRLHQTLDGMSDAFMLLDKDLVFRYLNPEASRLPEISDDLLGQRFTTVFPEEAAQPFIEKYQQALDTQESTHFTHYFTPLGIWFRVDAHPVPDGLAVYFRDISDEWQQGEQLRLLEAAVSRQNDILLITEAEPIDGPLGPRIVYVNDAFTRRTGFTREEAIGQTPRILQGPKTQRAELDRIGVALRNWQSVRSELINYTRSGEEFWLELDIMPLADENGWYTHWIAVERDITQRKEVEQAARVTEERFKIVARATSDVIWDWDLVQNTVWWNDGIVELFGFTREDLEPGPESWSSRIHADDRDIVATKIRNLIEGEHDTWHHEYRFLHADKRICYVIDQGFVIRDDAGKAIRLVASMVDVTEQRDLEERLRQAQKLEAVGQLTGGVAHDFNNLLTVILGNAELLKEQLTDHQLRELAEMTATAAERGAKLTQRLLAFARRQPLDPKLLDINQQIAAMETLLRRALSADIDIELVRAGGLWRAEIDPGQFESALLNLALNARDSMPQGGALTIETANTMLDEAYSSLHSDVDPGQYVMISVSDTGTGMLSEISDQAFEPFFTTKQVGKGSGLGLSMVYGFVKQSGGHIKIYSEPGEGTAVKMYFPRAYSGVEMETEPAHEATTSSHNEHILLVEDDQLVRDHVRSMLGTLGYRVTTAESGAQAMDIIQRTSDLDLLFTDIVMPGGMNGRELATLASALRPDLRVLFTSGYTENAIVHQGRLDRGVHLLSKPYRRQELASKLRKVLDSTTSSK